MIYRLLQLYAHTPEHPCKLRLFGFACRLLKRGQPLDLRVAGGLHMRLDPFDHVDRALVLTDWHEKLTTEFLRRNLSPGARVLVAGAHVGYHVLNAARAVGAAGLVVGCEPVPVSFARASEHVERNGCGAQVKLLRTALGETRGTVTMAPPPADNTGAAHLAPTGGGSVTAPLRTIADVLEELHVPRLDFLLLDVEGHEWRALRGLGPHRPPLLVLECDPRLMRETGDSPDAFFAWLRAAGYTLHTVGGAPVTEPDYYPEANIVAVHAAARTPHWV